MNYKSQVQKAFDDKLISEGTLENVNIWLEGDKYFEYRDELYGLIETEEWEIIEDNFFMVVPFGTGGRRGTVGVGSNRINRVTIGEAAQAVCNYQLEQDTSSRDKGLVIAYDSRLTSVEFSEYVASIFSANGFKTYLFSDVRSTPELSFAVRELDAAGGVVISASHNPASDNGIKVYWNDGGLLVPPYEQELLAHGERVEKIETMPLKEAEAQSLLVRIDNEIDEKYIQQVIDQSLSDSRSAHIVFTPLHGAGLTSVGEALPKAGFEDFELFEPQSTFDGSFPNVANQIPNPEVPETNADAADYAEGKNADVVFSTDPDADRLAITTWHENGDRVYLNGNQSAVLAAQYILDKNKEQGTLTDKHFMTSTIVTTDMLDAQAEAYGLKMYSHMLVGFKYIAEQVKIHQDDGDGTHLFGGEESFGSLVGSYTRDKDAAGTAIVLAELISELKDEGRTVMSYLYDQYRRYGLYQEYLHNIFFKGAKGFADMGKIMEHFRGDNPDTIGGYKVHKVLDYLPGELADGRVENVLTFELDEDRRTRITIRPSGTEPKIKIYAQMFMEIDNDLSDEQVRAKQEAALKTAKDLCEAVEADFQSVIS